MRRTLIRLFAALIAAGAAAFGGLWMATPAADTAAPLARAAARNRGIGFPGPAPGSRFEQALIATEDHRFYSPIDPGIDPIAVARVIYGRISGMRDQGGSTIEQQLAKMLYPSTRGTVLGTLEQIVIGIKLYFAYPRAEILSMYADTAYYGSGYYGLPAASEGYFGRLPGQLDWAQAAILAGVVNAPARFDPRTHPAACQRREAHVFRRLIAVGALTAPQADLAMTRPLRVVASAVSRPGIRQPGSGQATQP